MTDGQMTWEERERQLRMHLEVLRIPKGAIEVVVERVRQIEVEERTPDKDVGASEDLTQAGVCYGIANGSYSPGNAGPYDEYHFQWPWARSFWKPSADRKKNLRRAAALFAAAIDALEAEDGK
jgi:hypothetical protein